MDFHVVFRVFVGVTGMMGDSMVQGNCDSGITFKTSKTSGGSHFFCWPGGSEREQLEIKEDNFLGIKLLNNWSQFIRVN